MEILKLTYISTHNWLFDPPTNYSWVFRLSYKTTDLIKPSIWIQSVNLQSISLFNDPCCFEIPLAYKPTFFNMDMDFENIQVRDLIEEEKWDHSMLHNSLGPRLDSSTLTRSSIVPNAVNTWVWYPPANYNILSWNIWLKVWKLNVASRIKFFTWLFEHDSFHSLCPLWD